MNEGESENLSFPFDNNGLKNRLCIRIIFEKMLLQIVVLHNSLYVRSPLLWVKKKGEEHPRHLVSRHNHSRHTVLVQYILS